jgi:SPP1 gp7 family putative phage head morphogenesis protein
VAELTDSIPNRFLGVAGGVEDSFLRELHAGKLGGARIHDGIYRSYYDQIIEQAELGWGRKFHSPRSEADLRMFEGLRQSASRFSAAKHHTLAAELRKLRGLPLKDFMRESRAYLSLQNQSWLRTEARSAMVAASSAENWDVYQRRAYLYPNLRYNAIRDELTRPQHLLWDGAIYPIDHPIWDTRMPPNGYNCRCGTTQTDAEPNGLEPEFEPTRGFTHNPGKTGTLFSDDHPYYYVTESRALELRRNGEVSRYRAVSKVNTNLAIERYVGRSFDLPDTARPGRITADRLTDLAAKLPRTSVASPAVASDLLPALDVVIPQLLPVGDGVYRFDFLGVTYLFEFIDAVLVQISTS